MGDSSDIDSLIKDMNSANLSNEENSMVNSILNELNGENQQAPKITSQQNMPQISDEEKEMLIKQQIQQQKIAQQRMAQQQMQQQQMQQQQMQQQQQQQMQQQIQKETEKPSNMTDTIKTLLYEYKDVLIVLLLSILFNLDIITENLKIKNVSFMYDMEKGKETILSIILKGVIIATIFLLFKLFIK